MNPQQPYHYQAQCCRVIDGDTIIADIDIGFGVMLQGQKIRLAGINAPELKTQKGYQSYVCLKTLIEGKPISLSTIKASELGLPKEKYGRYLGVVWVRNRNINEQLVQMGYARPY